MALPDLSAAFFNRQTGAFRCRHFGPNSGVEAVAKTIGQTRDTA